MFGSKNKIDVGEEKRGTSASEVNGADEHDEQDIENRIPIRKFQISPQSSISIGNSLLDSARVRKMAPYFAYSAMISPDIDKFFKTKSRQVNDGHHQDKSHERRGHIFDQLLLHFTYLFFARCLVLAFVDDVAIRAWLGETQFIRPQRQMVMIFTIISMYVALSKRSFARSRVSKFKLNWLEPFDVLRGEQPPQTYGLTCEMMHAWYSYTFQMWWRYLLFKLLACGSATIFFAVVVRLRWNGYSEAATGGDAPSVTEICFNSLQIVWAICSVAWYYFSLTHAYVCFVYFNSLCYYFRLRFNKVNCDIETIINQRLKANDRVALMHHILHEHNELCLKVSEYNRFWSKQIMGAFFCMIYGICFTMFQAFFTANLIHIRVLMLIIAVTFSFFITKIAVSAAKMSRMAHVPYRLLIRATFDKYPIEMQIQLRLLIQRTSGPTIGFYCLDIFEITYTTYASILAALGQNFLLIVDFVRSYAQVGREYMPREISLDLLTEGMLNSTLNVLDEVAGVHISEQLKNINIGHNQEKN